MAPVPAEIDLFTIPHSRMKELVNTYTQKVQCADFRDCQQTFDLLKELQATLYEFKSHEYIENLFIMDQLKNRLKQRHIYNSAVCDCHNDNRLSKMLTLVRHGKQLGKSSIGERLNYGEELQKCFFEFVQKFLPHMEEEENIFQPLLVEHFEYDELKVLKEAVIEQHELIRDPLFQEKAELDLPETDSAIKDFRDIDSNIWSLVDLFEEPVREDLNPDMHQIQDSPLEFKDAYLSCAPDIECVPDSVWKTDLPLLEIETVSFNLPSEILIKIFGFLTPPDRGRCAQVCSYWNCIIYTPMLWKVIFPIQWARGIWDWQNANLNYILEDEVSAMDCVTWKFDEDADIDESEDSTSTSTSRQKEYSVFDSVISYLLPKIGRGVKKLVLDAGRGITSSQIRQALKHCPYVSYLSVAYTPFSYHTIKWVNKTNCLSKLRHLDLQGCTDVDDNCLYMLSDCLRKSRRSRRKCKIQMCMNHSFQDVNLHNVGYYCPYFSYNLCNLNSHHSNASSPQDCPYLESISNTSTDTSEPEGDPEIEELHSLRTFTTKPRLEYLNLSGCYEVTEEGLSYLLNKGVLQNLTYLNISSCFEISGIALRNIARQCRHLSPENLTYCNNIINGPYPSLSNGCDNLNHPIKTCCQARL